MQIHNVLVFTIAFAVVIIPGVVLSKKKTTLLQGTGQATGAGSVHTEDADNPLGSGVIHAGSMGCHRAVPYHKQRA